MFFKHKNSDHHRELSKKDLLNLSKRSQKVLKKLVTKSGIYASTAAGWEGPFHARFGRDSAITANLIFEAELLAHKGKLSKKAFTAVEELSKWQGRVDNPETGEEFGKIPHEIRPAAEGIFRQVHQAGTNVMPWYIDPNDKFLKNWDSADGTSLWIITLARGLNLHLGELKPDRLIQLKNALTWCLNNMQGNGWLVGFLGADLQPGRIYSGLHNQGWRDSPDIYQYPNGKLAQHPIKDVLVNAEVWSALKYGQKIFEKHDPEFTKQLVAGANELKARFNSDHEGFLLNKTAEPFFATALDGKDRQIKTGSVDVAACLWAYYKNEAVVDDKYISSIVKRTMQSDLFNPAAGLRNISLLTPLKTVSGYHDSPYTYWPFMSAMTVKGFDHFGYKEEAQAIAEAMLYAVRHFHSFVELFVEKPKKEIEIWHHPTIEQRSSANQAWTAAGVYYCSQYLLQS
jgi:glycogen debranching enzyme